MVIKTHEGSFLPAKSCWFRLSTLLPNIAEAYGIREALSWIKNLGFHSVVVESDCQAVANDILCAKTPGSLHGMLVADCIQLLSKIPSCRISFVSRSANHIARTLARASVFMSGPSE